MDAVIMHVKCLKLLIHILLLSHLRIFGVYSEEAKSANLTTDSLLVSDWPDEEGMRRRMEEYAREKLSHHYHWHSCGEDDRRNCQTGQNSSNNERRKRRKRDFGIASGSISYAILSGVIGMTASAVSDLTSYRPRVSDGGCEWFGRAPLCRPNCPSGYDYIRSDNGRCSNFWFSSKCIPDDSFGEPCSTMLGSYYNKKFCCKSDRNDCTWSGRWMGANTAYNAYCRYDNSVGRCGQLSCSINHHDHKAMDRTLINGTSCDQLSLFNFTGIATCGYIVWFDSDDKVINSWYKAT